MFGAGVFSGEATWGKWGWSGWSGWGHDFVSFKTHQHWNADYLGGVPRYGLKRPNPALLMHHAKT